MRYLKMTEEQVDFHKYAHQCLKVSLYNIIVSESN